MDIHNKPEDPEESFDICSKDDKILDIIEYQTITMTEESTQDQTEYSAPLVQTPDTLRIDLPCADPEDVHFTLLKFLVQLLQLEWEIMKFGSMRCTTMSEAANYCMDIIQTFAQDIVDIVLPQVYKYTRTHGIVSPPVLVLTEDQIHDYLGDSLQQALCKSLKTEGQKIEVTKMFSHLLLKNVTKTVNAVLALVAQTPIDESKIPMVFVSGRVTPMTDLKDMVHQIACLLTRVKRKNREFYTPVSLFDTKSHLIKLLTAYLLRVITKLKSRPLTLRDVSSTNRRDICITVGTNTSILTEEDSESDGHYSPLSSCSDLDALPGVVPDSSDTRSHYECCPLSSVTDVAVTEDYSCHLKPEDVTVIEEIAEKLVDKFLQEDPERLEQIVSGGPELVDNFELADFTDMIFTIFMGKCFCHFPVLLTRTRICDTVMHKKPMRGRANTGIAAGVLYLRIEEVLTRCVIQVLLWPLLCADMSPNKQKGHLGLTYTHEHIGAGDIIPVYTDSDVTYDLISEPVRVGRESDYWHIPLIMLIWEMFDIISIYDGYLVHDMKDKLLEGFEALKLHKHLSVFLKDKNYKDLSQIIVDNLVLEFGSEEELKIMAISGDERLSAALLRQLKEQLLPPAKKTTCGTFKKFKRLFCRKISPVISLTSDLDISQSEDTWSEGLTTDQAERRQAPLMTRITASTRKMFSRSKKMFSAIGRAVSKPFFTCISPETD